MACVCRTCLQHSATLGIAHAPSSKSAIHKAYRAAAKLWHPDRFENNNRKRLEAEERFKRIQIAYRELCEHFENPQRRLVERGFERQRQQGDPPTIFFGDSPYCFSAPYFPELVEKLIVEAALGGTETAVGFVNMSAATASKMPSRYILLTNFRLFIRDATEIVHFLWYADLGEVEYIHRQAKKPGAWQRIVTSFIAQDQRYTLRIQRRNGDMFYTLTERPDDRVKKVIYNFLRQMKSESQS